MDPDTSSREPSAYFTCPSCGYEMAAGTPTCGNCGSDLRAYSSGGAPLASRSSGAPGLIRLLVLLAVLGGGYLVFADEVRRAVDEVRRAVEDFEAPSTSDAPQIATPAPAEGVSGVRDLVRRMNQGGFPCRKVEISSSDDFLESGSCRSRGRYVFINVFFQQESLDLALEATEGEVDTYLHDENWFIFTDPALNGPIARALNAD